MMHTSVVHCNGEQSFRIFFVGDELVEIENRQMNNYSLYSWVSMTIDIQNLTKTLTGYIILVVLMNIHKD